MQKNDEKELFMFGTDSSLSFRDYFSLFLRSLIESDANSETIAGYKCAYSKCVAGTPFEDMSLKDFFKSVPQTTDMSALQGILLALQYAHPGNIDISVILSYRYRSHESASDHCDSVSIELPECVHRHFAAYCRHNNLTTVDAIRSLYENH